MGKQHGKRRVRDTRSAETRAADYLTVGWLVSALTTLLCEIISVAAAWLASGSGADQRVELFSGFLLFASLATGLVTLLLTPLVCLSRKAPPPRGITVFAVVVAVIPLLILLARGLK